MKHQIRKTATGPVLVIALSIFVAACGGKQTVASKSAEAFREAQQKGTPMGGEGHGGHSAGQGVTASAGDPASMAGMDHSKMDMSGQKSMAGMQHGSPEPVEISIPTTNGEMQRLRPADTLSVDAFDAPASISVAEAMKTPEGASGDTPEPAMSGHAQHVMTAPVPDRNSTPAPVMDHSQHGQPAAVAKPKQQRTTTARPKSAPAEATIYACPMHPEVRSDKPGTCPKCGMALTKQNKRTNR